MCVIYLFNCLFIFTFLGIKGTKCNIDPSKGEINDPCVWLFDAFCQGQYCACPLDMHEDPILRRCVPVNPQTPSGGDGGGLETRLVAFLSISIPAALTRLLHFSLAHNLHNNLDLDRTPTDLVIILVNQDTTPVNVVIQSKSARV